MKRAALIVALLTIASWAAAQGGQSTQNPPTQNPPSGGQATQGAPAGGQAAPGAQPTPPAGKRPPQLKSKQEQDAYNAAAAITDPAGLEKAADDFATKFPDSEVRVLLYKNVMRFYQNTNNYDKTEAMGRKVLNLDSDDPEALIVVAEVIAEKTKDSDLDKDQRYDEAMKLAKKAIQTVDTDLVVPADKLEAAKGYLRSSAYSIVGTIQFKNEDFVGAQENLQKSIDAYPSEPDPITVLRLALSLDKQQKYPEALKVVNRAIEVAQAQKPSPNANVVSLGQRERDRLQQLTGGTPAPAQQPQSQPPQN